MSSLLRLIQNAFMLFFGSQKKRKKSAEPLKVRYVVGNAAKPNFVCLAKVKINGNILLAGMLIATIANRKVHFEALKVSDQMPNHLVIEKTLFAMLKDHVKSRNSLEKVIHTVELGSNDRVRLQRLGFKHYEKKEWRYTMYN